MTPEASDVRLVNVLLLLSTQEPPDPKAEVSALSDACLHSPDKTTYFATTRLVRLGLTKGSIVALYNDYYNDHCLLGYGYYRGFLESGTDACEEAYRNTIYQDAGHPATYRGLIKIHAFRECSDMEELDGILEDGRPLTQKLLVKMDTDVLYTRRFGLEKASIYFLRGRPQKPSLEERRSLLFAKVEELKDKTARLAELWQEAADKYKKEAKDHEEADLRAGRARESVKSLRRSSSKRTPQSKRFGELVRARFSHLSFLQDSLEYLFHSCCQFDAVWDVLRDLQANRAITVPPYYKKVKFAGGFTEVHASKPDSARIYYREYVSGSYKVLISPKADQGVDKKYLGKGSF